MLSVRHIPDSPLPPVAILPQKAGSDVKSDVGHMYDFGFFEGSLQYYYPCWFSGGGMVIVLKASF